MNDHFKHQEIRMLEDFVFEVNPPETLRNASSGKTLQNEEIAGKQATENQRQEEKAGKNVSQKTNHQGG